MSDDVPDCCECRLERFVLLSWTDEPVVAHGGNLDNPPAGDRPLNFFWHGDWCKHRPTKALVGVAHNSAAPNGTVRVFVEGASDFSKYVWAEMEYEAAVPFPERDTLFHTQNGTPALAYGVPFFGFINKGPAFGIANGTHVPSFRSLEDPDNYLKSAWPVYLPTHSTAGVGFSVDYPSLSVDWAGTRCRVRWGYRQNGADTTLGSVVFPENFSSGFVYDGGFSGNPVQTPGGLGTLAIGCNWDDILTPNVNDNVLCGVELLRLGFFGFHGYFQNVSSFGTFTIPFEMPRSFFTDNNSVSQPSPPLSYRLVGVEATAPRLTVPVLHLALSFAPVVTSPGFVYGQSTNLDIASVESLVTCGARRSNVFIAPSLQSETGTLPAGPVGAATPPAGGIITAAEPLFVRRDDLNERSYNHVANADSWHATHLVRFGSALAGRNVLHNLNLEFDPCTFPGGAFRMNAPDYVSPGPMRANLFSTGSDFLISRLGGVTFGEATGGSQFAISFAEDSSEPNDENTLPRAWVWDAISGGVTLTAVAFTGERMVPNSYHVFYGESPLNTFSETIAVPPGYTGAGQFFQIDPREVLSFLTPTGNPFNPFVLAADQDAEFAQYESVEVPARVRDYRGEWTIETFPQIWATTQLNEEWQRAGPRNISLENSGMTTENHDGYSGGGYRLDYVPESAGVTIRVFGRLGIKISLTRVQGFRRVRQRQQIGNSVFFQATSDVAVYGDYEPGDVACHEQVFDFHIPLTGQDVESISAGQTVQKHLNAGTYQLEPDESGNPVFADVFRTVRISVDQAS